LLFGFGLQASGMQFHMPTIGGEAAREPHRGEQ
jgi:hypothetical protein